jgi:hypothetical protein
MHNEMKRSAFASERLLDQVSMVWGDDEQRNPDIGGKAMNLPLLRITIKNFSHFNLLSSLPIGFWQVNGQTVERANRPTGKRVDNLMSEGLDYKRFFRFAILPLILYFIRSLMERLSPKALN